MVRILNVEERLARSCRTCRSFVLGCVGEAMECWMQANASRQRGVDSGRTMSLGRRLFSAFVSLSSFGRGVMVCGAVLATAAAAHAGRRLVRGPAPDELRRQVQQKILEHDFIAAHDLLGRLEHVCHGLSEGDATQLRPSIDRGLASTRRALFWELGEHRRYGQWSEALATLKQLELAGLDILPLTYTRAEVLEDAGRLAEAEAAFADYIRLGAEGRRAAEAQLRRASLLVRLGAVTEARIALDDLLADAPPEDIREAGLALGAKLLPRVAQP